MNTTIIVNFRGNYSAYRYTIILVFDSFMKQSLLFKTLFAFLLFIVFDLQTNAQDKQKYTISGYVKDASNGEYSIGANVYIKELLKGGNTNQYGFFSITVEKGNYTLVSSYVGYGDFVKQIVLDRDISINIELKPTSINVKEVEISSEKIDKNVTSTSVGAIKLDMEEIKKLPAFLGEVDILKTIQLLPGVKSSGDGNSGFYVRGGGPDQNLILLDEAVVYNASHLLGFFSVFNGDAVKSINLVKGGMPAQYGGRLASVLDISMKEGNNKTYHASGGIGLISSRLTVEGPIKKDTGSFIVSARRTYLDVLARPFAKPDSPLKNSGVYFYDMNAKVNYRLSDKDRIFASGYFGRDIMKFEDKDAGFKMGVAWGNSTGVVRWNHLFSNKLFMNVSAIVSDYQFSFTAEQTGFELKLFSGINDLNGKVDFGYFPTIRHEVKFGANYIFHTFTPMSATAKQGETEFDLGGVKKLRAHDMAAYVSDDFDVTDNFKIHLGLRYSYFMQIGPFDRYVKDPVTGQIASTIHTDKNKKVADHGGFEPRFNARYSLNTKSSLKASYTYNLQYIHLASLSAVTLPIDTWVPSSEVVNPQKGSQYSLGYFRNFKDNTYETSVELYYKDLKNQIEYADGSLPGGTVGDNADNQFVFGKGEAYGVELFVKKRTGKFNGWVGYTLSYTKRTFPDLNRGKEFYAKYDRRHDASVVLSYDLNKKWTFATIFVYGTGNAITIPTSYYVIDGNITYDYSDRNAFRMPAYHRLDISATFTPDRSKHIERRKKRIIRKFGLAENVKPEDVKIPRKMFKNYESSWNFSVFNVYNRHNPYIIYFANEGSATEGNLSIKAKQVYLFPVIPSVTWNFKF